MPLVKKKNKLVFWLVSHCETDNKREEYAKTLNKYIPVDIFGGCNWTETLNRDTPEFRIPFTKLYKPYKFYLAFENSNCYEYVSEKFFRALQHGLVPIVMGGANNYEKIAPKKSYIKTKDFKSPRKLAEYLKYLDSNDNEYLKYFDWTHDYQFYEQRQESLDALTENYCFF